MSRIDYIDNGLRYSILLGCIYMLMFVKGINIFGIKGTFIPLKSVFSTLLAECGGTFGLLLYGGARCIVSITKSSSFIILNTFLPGFFSGLHWLNNTITTGVIVPLICMLLFMVHPVGFDVFLYSFIWLIPAAITLERCEDIFCKALASTLVAHAVGSVIYLYAMQTTIVFWIRLVPIVLVERFLTALLITGAYKLMHMISIYPVIERIKTFTIQIPLLRRV